MNVKTVQKWTHYVMSNHSGTITTTDGVLLTRFQAGVQAVFVAPSTEIVCSDDTAEIRPIPEDALCSYATEDYVTSAISQQSYDSWSYGEPLSLFVSVSSSTTFQTGLSQISWDSSDWDAAASAEYLGKIVLYSSVDEMPSVTIQVSEDGETWEDAETMLSCASSELAYENTSRFGNVYRLSYVLGSPLACAGKHLRVLGIFSGILFYYNTSVGEATGIITNTNAENTGARVQSEFYPLVNLASELTDCATSSDVYSARGETFSTINTGTAENSLAYLVYLARAQAPIGTISKVSWDVPSDVGLTSDQLSPHYLVIYEIIKPATEDTNSEIRFVGCSTESKAQVMGETVEYEFEGASTQGGDLQLSMVDAAITASDPLSTEIEADNFFLCKSTPVTDDDKYSGLVVLQDGALAVAARVMDCSFEVESPAKFTTEDRVESLIAASASSDASESEIPWVDIENCSEITASGFYKIDYNNIGTYPSGPFGVLVYLWMTNCPSDIYAILSDASSGNASDWKECVNSAAAVSDMVLTYVGKSSGYTVLNLQAKNL